MPCEEDDSSDLQPGDTVQNEDSDQDFIEDPHLPSEIGTAIEKREYCNELNEYSQEMLSTFKEHKLKGEQLWIEFTNIFKLGALRNLSGRQQLARIQFLRKQGVMLNKPGDIANGMHCANVLSAKHFQEDLLNKLWNRTI